MSALSPQLIGFLSIGFLLLLIALRCPIALAMMLAGLGGFAAIVGHGPALAILETAPFDVATSYSFTMVPLFILMGNFAVQAGLSADLFTAARRLMRGWRGGLALASVTACGGFSAVSGSSLATAATMARVALPEMRAHGYSMRLATGSLAAGGTLGIMIPPSIALLLYALITEQSVGAMFLAGFLPGILAYLLYIVTIIIVVRFSAAADMSLKEDAQTLAQALIKAIPVVVLFGIVMGGLYGGLFTPTEAAGAGAFVALLFALFRGMRHAGFATAIRDTIRTSASIFLIIIGAEIFGYLLSVSQISFELVSMIRGMGLEPWQVLLIIIGFFIVFGLFMDSLAMILLTVPIFYPLVIESGFDPIWFGIVAVVAVELGLITPPVGMNLFVIKSVAPDVSMRDIMMGCLPFVFADIVRLGLLVLFPAIALFIPNLLGAH
ncbi:MAG: TRAP transporter large permease [Aquisalimonadaceae bacterium]